MANMNATLDNRHKLALPYWARPGVALFAKKVDTEGGDDENDDDEDDDEEDDDDEEEDPDADKSPEELAAELKRTRAALTKANKDGSRNRKKYRTRVAELESAQGKAGGKKDDDEDVEERIRKATEAAKSEVTSAADQRIIRSEAKAALTAKGADPAKVKKLIGLLDMDDLEVDDDGVDGLDEAVDELVSDWPELFGTKKGGKRIQGRSGRSGDEGGKKVLTATEQQARQLTKGR